MKPSCNRSISRKSSPEITETEKEILSQDYAELAGLMSQLDNKTKYFKKNMETMLDSVPAQDMLTEMWESQAQAWSAAANTQNEKPKAESSTQPSGDNNNNNKTRSS